MSPPSTLCPASHAPPFAAQTHEDYAHHWLIGANAARMRKTEIYAWRGADGAGYHLSPTHFRLSFSAAYPREPPDVHVLSVCHHALLDDDKEVSALFYDADNLPPGKRGGESEESAETRKNAFLEYDARGVLAACRRFLSQPLALPGGANDDESGDDASEAGKRKRKEEKERLRLAWTSAARANEARDATVASFLRRPAGDPAGPLDKRWFDENGWPHAFFAPELLEVLDEIKARADDDAKAGDDGALSAKARRSVLKICREEAPGVFSFPMLAESACASLIREIEHFQSPAVNLPVRRPNSMNNYGVVLNACGFERTMDALQRDCVTPLARLGLGLGLGLG